MYVLLRLILFVLWEFQSARVSLSEEIDICLPYPEEDDINESKVQSSEIQQPALLTTDISDDDLL